MNVTAEKFGYPGTLLAEYDHWLVLLRPAQVTLGSLVLICKEKAARFGDIGPAASAELHRVAARIEKVIGEAFENDKINYLMLMMVDPDVHFHVLPRYSSDRSYEGAVFGDEAWPGPPQITHALEMSEPVFEALRRDLAARFDAIIG
jgi:diadenosine tetraphosphate (Ap4A) HIT family hydrolase